MVQNALHFYFNKKSEITNVSNALLIPILSTTKEQIAQFAKCKQFVQQSVRFLLLQFNLSISYTNEHLLV